MFSFLLFSGVFLVNFVLRIWRRFEPDLLGAFVTRVLVNIFVVFPIKSLRPRLDVDIKIWNSKLALEALNTSCLDALGIDIGNLLQYQTAFGILFGIGWGTNS